MTVENLTGAVAIEFIIALGTIIKMFLDELKLRNRDIQQEKAILEIQIFLIKQGFNPKENVK